MANTALCPFCSHLLPRHHHQCQFGNKSSWTTTQTQTVTNKDRNQTTQAQKSFKDHLPIPPLPKPVKS